ncbi:MAG TPA: DUF6314 family protein [Jatrophihabitans sp.]|nr:DUF6314 family protein [Jatrophihabitans sp.]
MHTVEPPQLLGRWRLHRRLADRRAGVQGWLTGTLDLQQQAPDRISWYEKGTLSWQGERLEVFREYAIVSDGSGWQVLFADGRPFHPWRPGELVEHPCRADRYRGLVVVDRDRTRLRVQWDVSGPAKDQRILSRCYRMDGTSPRQTSLNAV